MTKGQWVGVVNNFHHALAARHGGKLKQGQLKSGNGQDEALRRFGVIRCRLFVIGGVPWFGPGVLSVIEFLGIDGEKAKTAEGTEDRDSVKTETLKSGSGDRGQGIYYSTGRDSLGPRGQRRR